MAVVNPNIEDTGLSFNAMAVRDAVDLFAQSSTAFGTGVVTGCQVTGTGASASGYAGVVNIAAGSVTVAGVTYNVASVAANVASVATNADRRDTVIYRVGTGVTVVAGTPCSVTGAVWTTSSSANPPIKGQVVNTTATTGQISTTTDVVLAEVYVAYNTTSISTSTNVVDKTNVVGTRAAPAFSVTGLTSATQNPTRFVGATSSGPPATGTWTKGDVVVDYTGTIWVCTTSGNVGTWTPTVSSALYTRTLSSSSSVQATTGELTIVTQGSGTSASVSLPSGGTVAQNGALYQIKNLSPNPVTIFGPTGTNSASISVSGTVYAPGVAYTIAPNTAYTFNYTSSIWYCLTTTDLGAMGNYGAIQLEQAIRLQSLDQMSPPAADLSMNARRLVNVATPLFPTDGATGYAGFSTVTGAPTTGTWNTGNWVVDALGRVYICLASGTPGTWVLGAVGSSYQSLSASTAATAYTSVGASVSHLTSASLPAGTYQVSGQIALTGVNNGVATLWFATGGTGTSTWQNTAGSTPVAQIAVPLSTVYVTGTVNGILKVTAAGPTVSLVSAGSSTSAKYSGSVTAYGSAPTTPAILLTVVPIA